VPSCRKSAANDVQIGRSLRVLATPKTLLVSHRQGGSLSRYLSRVIRVIRNIHTSQRGLIA